MSQISVRIRNIEQNDRAGSFQSAACFYLLLEVLVPGDAYSLLERFFGLVQSRVTKIAGKNAI